MVYEVLIRVEILLISFCILLGEKKKVSHCQDYIKHQNTKISLFYNLKSPDLKMYQYCLKEPIVGWYKSNLINSEGLECETYGFLCERTPLNMCGIWYRLMKICHLNPLNKNIFLQLNPDRLCGLTC